MAFSEIEKQVSSRSKTGEAKSHYCEWKAID